MRISSSNVAVLLINKPSYVPAEYGIMPSELIQAAIRLTCSYLASVRAGISAGTASVRAGISAGTASVRTDVSGLIYSLQLNDRTAD